MSGTAGENKSYKSPTAENGAQPPTPCRMAELWYLTEISIILGHRSRPNEYESYVPQEALHEFDRRLKAGSIMKVTRRHFKLWAAVAEANGCERFTRPLGWPREMVEKHLLF